MKISFVVLVPLFIGYSSGVIVPSGIPKHFNNSKPVVNAKSNSNKTQNLTINLENSNKIDEKELFQTAAEKEKSLNERSFIIINKRFRTPLRNQLYNSQTNHLSKPFKISERLPQIQEIPQSSVQAYVNPLKELFNPNKKTIGAVKQGIGLPKHEVERLLHNQGGYKYTLQEMVQEPAQTQPTVKCNIESNYEHPRKNTQPKGSKENNINRQSQHISQQRMFYNHDPPYNPSRSVFNIKDVFFKPEDRNMMTDNYGALSIPLHSMSEEDQLLERYMKEINEIDSKIHKPDDCQNCMTRINNGNIAKCEESCKCRIHRFNKIKQRIKRTSIDDHDKF